MSQFIGGAQGQFMLAVDDKRASDALSDGQNLGAKPAFLLPLTSPSSSEDVASFRSAFWPAKSSLGGDAETMIEAAPWYERPWTNGGHMARGAFVGLALAQDGDVRPGATIRCYRSSTGEMTEAVLSTPIGTYQVTTPYWGESHYVTIHVAGPPETAGATADTVTPT